MPNVELIVSTGLITVCDQINSLQSKLSSVLDSAKEHANTQLHAASKRIRVLCSEAKLRDEEMTEKCAQVTSLEKQLCNLTR